MAPSFLFLLSLGSPSCSAAIGRKYARLDELGVPFGITVDTDTAADQCVTLRERDSLVQLRVPLTEVCGVVSDLCLGNTTYDQVRELYPLQGAPKGQGGGKGKEEAGAAPAAGQKRGEWTNWP